MYVIGQWLRWKVKCYDVWSQNRLEWFCLCSARISRAFICDSTAYRRKINYVKQLHSALMGLKPNAHNCVCTFYSLWGFINAVSLPFSQAITFNKLLKQLMKCCNHWLYSLKHYKACNILSYWTSVYVSLNHKTICYYIEDVN